MGLSPVKARGSNVWAYRLFEDAARGDLLGADATPGQRRLLYARTMAALTEYWRCHRQAAAQSIRGFKVSTAK